jgi:hypothetical protein
MPVTLLNAGDHLSLEFEEADLDRVRQCIRQLYPATTSRRAGIATLYSFGGCEFVFQNEWEDPCLISKSHEGDAILQTLHARLTSDEPATAASPR